MRRSHPVLATLGLASSLALAACSPGPLEVARLCPPAAVRIDGSLYAWGRPAAASDAGPQAGVVLRERQCEDVFVTVTDSAGPPASEPVPWVDGDAHGLPLGTPLYHRAGAETGSSLVVRRGEEWVELLRLPQQ